MPVLEEQLNTVQRVFLRGKIFTNFTNQQPFVKILPSKYFCCKRVKILQLSQCANEQVQGLKHHTYIVEISSSYNDIASRRAIVTDLKLQLVKHEQSSIKPLSSQGNPIIEKGKQQEMGFQPSQWQLNLMRCKTKAYLG